MFSLNTPNCGEVIVKYQTSIPQKDFFKIQNSAQSATYFRAKMFDSDMICFREEMGLTMLDNSNQVIGWCRISIGGLTGTACDPRVVFFHALHCGACKIILAHNHPSGTLRPSDPDIRITEKIKNAGNLFDIQLLDHLILTADSYYSFADEGLI